MIDQERPAWHASAACRGDERWLDEAAIGTRLEPFRAVCRGCPVAGECLAEALDLEPIVRHQGVLRCGVSGRPAWRKVEALVGELQPVTVADWTAFAAWIVDGDVANVSSWSCTARATA